MSLPIIVDVQATTGGELLLTSVRDVFAYVEGVKSDKRAGTAYECVGGVRYEQ